ncbi:DNA topology modulation protein [Planomicrobium sp. CPCC 101110]|uniref:DNA topology modulation protein n=1 Tax=Planomicrobium sp. CPCC 101110 TaxID=2599619 RepID=UPI0011B4E5DB|nr:DNA topology modulation protein [Planomicrobium sp. CPCC 101110]TWT26170.1 DNA topology modulation protein [Planomicrobium sp. CPCC 101110]
MKKIAIIGSGGSGKSTFSRALGKRLGIGVDHLDALLWKAGWEPTSRTEQLEIQQQLTQKESWIIDGNYNGTLELRLRAADTIVFLDMPRILCLYRVLKRRWHYRRKPRPDMAAGCGEKITFEFLKWVWHYPNTKRPHVLEMLEGLAGEKTIVVLDSPRKAETFLENLSTEQQKHR